MPPRDKPPQLVDKSAGATWLCELCKRGPNASIGTASGVTLGPLFGPYRVGSSATDAADTFMTIDEDSSSRQPPMGKKCDLWLLVPFLGSQECF